MYCIYMYVLLVFCGIIIICILCVLGVCHSFSSVQYQYLLYIISCNFMKNYFDKMNCFFDNIILAIEYVYMYT